MNAIKPEELKNLEEQVNNDEIIFEQLTETSLNIINDLKKLFPNWTTEKTIKKLNNTIKGKNKRFIVKKNGELIGHIKLFNKKSPHNHIIELTSLIIKKEERGKGIAKQLIEYSIKKNKNNKMFVLAVDTKNKKAIELYKKMGFKKYGLLKKGSFLNGVFVNNYLMVKELK
jgi:ribosomal protein S18 acetylase RimI-like enzyme